MIRVYRQCGDLEYIRTWCMLTELIKKVSQNIINPNIRPELQIKPRRRILWQRLASSRCAVGTSFPVKIKRRHFIGHCHQWPIVVAHWRNLQIAGSVYLSHALGDKFRVTVCWRISDEI